MLESGPATESILRQDPLSRTPKPANEPMLRPDQGGRYDPSPAQATTGLSQSGYDGTANRPMSAQVTPQQVLSCDCNSETVTGPEFPLSYDEGMERAYEEESEKRRKVGVRVAAGNPILTFYSPSSSSTSLTSSASSSCCSHPS